MSGSRSAPDHFAPLATSPVLRGASPRGSHRAGRHPAQRILAKLALVALTVASLQLTVIGAQTASADTVSTDPTLPATVSSDPLPTAQINGVVWSQVVVGDLVFVGGEFTKARPARRGRRHAGSQPHQLDVLQRDHRCDDQLRPSAQRPGQARHRLRQHGVRRRSVHQRQRVDAVSRGRLQRDHAAPLLSFAPIINGTVYGIAASATGVYIGGNFTSVNNTPRQGVAGFALPNYTLLAPVRPHAERAATSGNWSSRRTAARSPWAATSSP